jgi:capsular exopolysaccharide synthesis family protein
MIKARSEVGQELSLELYRHQNVVVNDAYDRLVAGIHLIKKNNGYSTFTITGCQPGVGTTTIAISLAISMAVSGCRTILIDTDMKKGATHKRLNQKIDIGLSEFLTTDISLNEVICGTNIENLKYISCGKSSSNVVELLCSNRFETMISQLKANFDIAVFDSPSLNATVDASILASKTDAVILVAEQFKSQRSQLKAAKRELDNVGANLLGVVLNQVDKDEYKRYLKNYDYFL